MFSIELSVKLHLCIILILILINFNNKIFYFSLCENINFILVFLISQAVENTRSKFQNFSIPVPGV